MQLVSRLKKLKQKGFSVLELMVVITVIGLVAAIGLPAISNFGVSENYQSDIALIRSQFNYVRQLALENGNAYRILIVNNDSNNTARLEVYEDQSRNRFNKEFHSSTTPPCSSFGGASSTTLILFGMVQIVNSNPGGIRLDNLTKNLNFFTIKKCTSLTGNCTSVTNANNYFCILPDATMPENARGQIQSSSNAGGKTDTLNVYESGFFNVGDRIQ